MASAPTIDKTDAIAPPPLPDHRQARLITLCAFLALLAVVAGIVAATHRQSTAMIGSDAAATSQAVVATAPPGVPSPTPLATRPPSPTPIPPTAPPTESPPTAAPPTPVPPTVPALAAPLRPAPAVNSNPNNARENGKGNGKGKEKGKGDGRGD